MKKYFCLLAIVCCYHFGFCQNDSGDTNLAIDYGGELSRIGKAASSPEAAVLTKHGNTPVSLYTGTPEIGIPLYQHQGREFNLPVQLSYDAQGVKVEQQATWVGLSWNLTIGGRVSRIVNGMPDDYISSDYQTIFNEGVRSKVLQYKNDDRYFDTEQEALAYFDFLESVSENRKDIEQDYFSVSAPGLNELVVIDLATLEAKSLKNPRTKITYHRSGYIHNWTITSDTGAKYYFETTETTHTQGNDGGSAGGVIKEYVSSWLLTKIESPNVKDVYEFNYVSTGYWNQPFASSPVSHVTNNLPTNPGGGTYDAGTGPTFQPTTKLNQQFLSNVSHNGNTILSTILKNRYDIALAVPSALDELRVYSSSTSSVLNGGLLKSIKFNHTYFGTTDQNPSALAADDIRLKLDDLEIKDISGITQQKYTFEYEDPSSVPSKKSFSQDYMGYFNGKSNSVLYPKVTRDGDTYNGANRDVNFSYAKKGMLTKITYPTGGYSLFEYESHKSKTPSSTSEVTRDYTYASLSVGGGIDPTNDDVCGPACRDMFGDSPAIRYTTFTIPDGSAYELTYNSRGNARAYIFKHVASALPEDHPFYNPNPIPYNHIINQQTNAAQVDFEWTSSGSADQRQIVLEPGGYQITLVNATPGESSSLRIYREETRTTVDPGGEYTVAGLRIKKITDYSDQGEKASAKLYTYVPGKMIFKPSMVYTTSKTISNGEDATTTSTLHRLSGASSNQPHIGYGRVNVKEQNINNSKTENGLTSYSFDVGADGIVTHNVRPHTNSYIPNYKVGKEKEIEVVDSSGTVLSKTENTFEDPLYFSTVGLSLTHNEGNSVKYIRIYRDPYNNKYTYEHLEPEWRGGYWGSGGVGGTVLPGSSGPSPAPPPACSEPGSTCISRFTLSTLALKRNLMQGKIGNTVQVRSTRQLKDEEVVTVNDMTYAPEVDYLLRSNITTSSNQLSQEVKYHYPKDYNNQLLMSANRLTEVLQSESYIDQKKIATRKTIMKDWGNGLILPELAQYAKGNTTLEDRIVYHSYDNQGNPLEISQPNGTHTIYIWGYQGQYPIVKISNASYTGMPLEVTNLLDQIKTSSNTEDSSAKEANIRGLYEQLRTHAYFATSQVTSYTYDPQIGVTSIIDPRGYTTYYEYDGSHRLLSIRDADQNIINRYYYNYKGEPIAPLEVAITSNSWVNTNTNLNIQSTVHGGSSNFSHNWSITMPDGEVLQRTDPTFTINTGTVPGIITVALRVKDYTTGVIETQNKSIQVYAPVTTSIVADSWMYTNTSKTFQANTTGGSDSMSYQWEITRFNGEVIHGTAKDISFASGINFGSASIKLTVKDNITAWTKTLTKTIFVYMPHVIQSIDVSSWMYTGATKTFTSTASRGSGNFTYAWEIKRPDNQTIRGTSKDIIFSSGNTTGTATLTLKITDTVTGRVETTTRSIKIYRPFTSSIQGISWMFTGASKLFKSITNYGSGNFTYTWRVIKSNSTAQSGSSKDINYLANDGTGSATVELKVKDNATGQTKTVTKAINIYHPHTISSLGVSSWMFVNTSKTFTSGVSGGSGNYKYNWEIKRPNNQVVRGTGKDISFSSGGTSGTATLTFTMTDNITGRVQTATRSIKIYRSLTAGITAPSWMYTGTTKTFQSSIGGGSNNLAYTWEITRFNGEIVRGTAKDISYASGISFGPATIKLTVKDNVTNQTKTVTKTIFVYMPHVIQSVGVSSWMYTGATKTFTSTASRGSGNFTYTWEIKRPNNQIVRGTSKNISFASGNTPGTASLTLTIKDSTTGRVQTTTRSIKIYRPFTVSYSQISRPSTLLVKNTASFNINPVGGSGNRSYSWKIISNHTTYTSIKKSFSLYMDYKYYGNVRVQCTVRDNATGVSKTVATTMNVKENAWTAALRATNVVWGNKSKDFKLVVDKTGGSGNYSYKWTRNNGNAGTASSITVNLACSGNADSWVTCILTDNYTGKKIELNETYTLDASICSSGGSGGGPGGGPGGPPDAGDPDH